MSSKNDPIMARRGVLITLMKDPGHFLALGGGSGLVPWAPGTCGTVVGVAVYLSLAGLEWPLYCAVTGLLFLLGVPLCGRTASALGEHDHPAIVWDEVVGYLVTMSFVKWSVASILLGFLLFRFFDIVKPWPIRLLDQHVSGGFGIMVDDLLAGVFAGTLLVLINYLSYI